MTDGGQGDEQLRLRVATKSGRVQLVAESRPDILVTGAKPVVTGSTTTVDVGSSRVSVRVPVGTEVIIGSTSGRVEVTGQVGRAAILTESGRIGVEQAEALDVRATSARVDVGAVVGECRVRTTSGRINVKSAGRADVACESGRIDLDMVAGPVRAHTISGRVEIGMTRPADVEAETISGRISVTVPRGTRAWLITDTEEPAPAEGYDCVIRARSLSGRVRVTER